MQDQKEVSRSFSLQVREVCFSLLYETVVVASFKILVAELLRISFLWGRTPHALSLGNLFPRLGDRYLVRKGRRSIIQ